LDVSGEVYTMVALIPGKEPQYTLSGKINGTQRRSGQVGEEKKLSCPCWDSSLWSSTPWATPQTDYTLPVPLSGSGSCTKEGFAKPVLSVCFRTAIWKLATLLSSLQNTMWPPLHWLSPNDLLSMSEDFQDVRKNSEKKELHSMQFGFQTRLFKLVSCKPEDSDFLHDETRLWCIVKRKQKDEADVSCV
jgi:hypothetical protein